MSPNNSVTPGVAEREIPEARPVFDIPADLARRYVVRIVEPQGGGERRLGMFLAGDGSTPSLEIANDRIVARDEARETIASLVKLAEHNQWRSIDVEGSPGFREAVWAAGSRNGLIVTGYEPSFAEAERMEKFRRDDAERRGREAASRAAPVTRTNLAEAREGTEEGPRVGPPVGAMAAKEAVSSAATVSRETPASSETMGAAPPDERAIVERAFERGLLALEASGDPRALTARATAAAFVDQIYGVGEERSLATSIHTQAQEPDPTPAPVRDARQREADDDRRRESDQLAELFLTGDAERLESDPRLSNALQAQASMERHIAEVFQTDAAQRGAANLESRQMISDVLRRGLDVSVREPSPVRQIEPVQQREMER